MAYKDTQGGITIEFPNILDAPIENLEPGKRPLNDKVDDTLIDQDMYRIQQDYHPDRPRMGPPGEAPTPAPGNKLAEFRTQYPQYDDMSDSKLTASLYKKFYSDMPLESFLEKIQVSPAEEKRVTDAPGRILKALKDFPSLSEMVMSFLDNVEKSVKSGGKDEIAVFKAAADVAAGGFARGTLSKEAAGTLGSSGGRPPFTVIEGGIAKGERVAGKPFNDNTDITKELRDALYQLPDAPALSPYAQAHMENAIALRLAHQQQKLREEAIKKGSIDYKGSRFKELEGVVEDIKRQIKDMPSRAEDLGLELKTVEGMLRKYREKNPGDIVPIDIVEMRLLDKAKAGVVDVKGIVQWLKSAGAEVFEVKNVKGTQYIKFGDPGNPKIRSEATANVRIPDDGHISNNVSDTAVGNMFDTGTRVGYSGREQLGTTLNVSGASYSKLENLLDALKWKLSKSPDGQWLISPDKAPRSRPSKGEQAADTAPKDPNQLEMDFNGPQSVGAARTPPEDIHFRESPSAKTPYEIALGRSTIEEARGRTNEAQLLKSRERQIIYDTKGRERSAGATHEIAVIRRRLKELKDEPKMVDTIPQQQQAKDLRPGAKPREREISPEQKQYMQDLIDLPDKEVHYEMGKAFKDYDLTQGGTSYRLRQLRSEFQAGQEAATTERVAALNKARDKLGSFLKMEESTDMFSGKVFTFKDKSGSPYIQIDGSFENGGKTFYVESMHAPGITGDPQNAFGIAIIKHVFEQIIKAHPDVETIAGWRISGARVNTGKGDSGMVLSFPKQGDLFKKKIISEGRKSGDTISRDPNQYEMELRQRAPYERADELPNTRKPIYSAQGKRILTPAKEGAIERKRRGDYRARMRDRKLDD